MFRGANLASQTKQGAPYQYLPIQVKSLDPVEIDTALASAQVLGSLAKIVDLGFNVIRLVVIWKGAEPTYGGGLNTAYLDAIKAIIRKLYSFRMFVIVDFHQDNISDLYSGDGFPDWPVAVDDEHPKPDPGVKDDKLWSIRGFVTVPFPPIVLNPAKGGFATLNDLIRNTIRSFWQKLPGVGE